MKREKTFELRRLAKVDATLEHLLSGAPNEKDEHRWQLLEATAARVGGFDV